MIMRRFLVAWLGLTIALSVLCYGLRANLLQMPFTSSCTSNALAFNGTNSAAVTPSLSYSAPTVLSVSLWFKAAAFNTSDGILLESTNGGLAGGYRDDPNSGAPVSGDYQYAVVGSVGSGVTGYTRPSTGAWHHAAAIYGFANLASSSTGSPTVSVYFDGVLQTAVAQVAGSGATTFADAVLNLGSRSGSSLFAAIDIARVSIFPGATLTGPQVTSLFGGANPTTIGSGAKYYWTVDSTSSMANLGSGGTAAMTSSNTTVVSGPAVCFL